MNSIWIAQDVVVVREVRGGKNHTIYSGFIYGKTGQLWFQLPPFPLTWGMFPLCMYRHSTFSFFFLIFSFSFFFLSEAFSLHLIASRETEIGILREPSRKFSRMKIFHERRTPIAQLPRWAAGIDLTDLGLPWAGPDISSLQVCCGWKEDLARIGCKCLWSSFLFFLSFFMDMGKNIGEPCPQFSKGQGRRWRETSVELGVLP